MISQKIKILIESNMENLKKHIDLNYALVDMSKIDANLQLNSDAYVPLLSKKEIEYLSKLKIYNRKLQWICGRYAVKKALFKYKALKKSIVNLNCVDVLKGADSAPYIPQYKNINVSITHSFPYCVGVVSESNVGVDVEKVFKVENSLIDFFFTDKEKSFLSKITDPRKKNMQAIKHWTRKEAVSKFFKLGMKMNFKKLDTLDDTLKIGGNEINIFSFVCNECCLSLAFASF